MVDAMALFMYYLGKCSTVVLDEVPYFLHSLNNALEANDKYFMEFRALVRLNTDWSSPSYDDMMEALVALEKQLSA